MGFSSPSSPRLPPPPPPEPVSDPYTVAQVEEQQRRRALRLGRSALVIDPSLNTPGGSGLNIG